jgi:hypothetical protein
VATWRAHEICAMTIPETWIDEVGGERRVFGVDAIVKDRWNLVSRQTLTVPDCANTNTALLRLYNIGAQGSRCPHSMC